MRIIPDDVWAKDYADLEYDTIEINDWTWRPDNWGEYIEYFNDRPFNMTAKETWEFGATSMLNALMSLERNK
jgi:hypothetical protein